MEHPEEHPDEGQIHTWLDGQLSEADASAMEAHVASCAECRSLVAEARGFVAAASRVVASLDDVPSGVIPKVEPVKRIVARRAWWNRPQLAAAALVFVMAGSAVVVGLGEGDDVVGTEIREMALDATPASTEAAASAGAPAGAPAPRVASPAVQRELAERSSTASGQVAGRVAADLAAPAPVPAPARALADAALPAPAVAPPAAAAPAPVLAQAAVGATSNAAGVGAGGAVAGGRAARSLEQRSAASPPVAEVQLQAKSFAAARTVSLAGCYAISPSPTDVAGRWKEMPRRLQLTDSASADSPGWRAARDQDRHSSRLSWASSTAASFVLRRISGIDTSSMLVSIGNANAPDNAVAVRGGC
ncbi:MAG TPA: zf-HC2 domain-containing protein [Gemmatimonas sp.]|nr:zf-HC2 domain-containing protein [Gemmatimonas sp.]